MSLHHIFSDATASTIDITDRVRTPGPPATSYSVRDDAEEGSVAISEMTIDDPDGDLIVTGLRRIYSYEDEAPVGDQLVHNGFTFGEKVIRGPNRVGAGRQWLVTLTDVNTLLNRRVMNGADANRPAENDTERILALMGMTELNTVDDDSMISLTAATTNMDAVDYRGQNVGQYIDDCRQASGKNAYVWYNEATGEYGLWYDFDYSTEFDSGCFLTTDESQQVDYNTVFGYSIDRTWFNFDPSRVVSGGYMTGPFGTLYDQNATTITNFAAVDRAIPAENVKTLTAAQSRMDRYLEDGSTEELIIHTVMTKVPRSKVNAVKKGYLVSFKAEWGPGLEAYVVGRVLYRHVTEITEDPVAGYEIEMDITPIPAPCEGDQEHFFPGTQPTGGFIYEISNVAMSPVDSGIINSQPMATLPYQPPALTPGNGTSSILIAGYVFDNEGTNAPACTSSEITIDNDTNAGDATGTGFAPETVVGHKLIAVASGSYSPDVVSSPSPFPDFGEVRGWAAAAAVFLASGGTPTVVQSTSGAGVGSGTTLTLPAPPIEGNLLVAFVNSRQHPGGLTVPSGWTALAQIETPVGGGPVARFGRLMWKAVCE